MTNEFESSTATRSDLPSPLTSARSVAFEPTNGVPDQPCGAENEDAQGNDDKNDSLPSFILLLSNRYFQNVITP